MAVAPPSILPGDSECLSPAALKVFFASIPLEFIGEPTHVRSERSALAGPEPTRTEADPACYIHSLLRSRMAVHAERVPRILGPPRNGAGQRQLRGASVDQPCIVSGVQLVRIPAGFRHSIAAQVMRHAMADMPLLDDAQPCKEVLVFRTGAGGKAQIATRSRSKTMLNSHRDHDGCAACAGSVRQMGKTIS